MRKLSLGDTLLQIYASKKFLVVGGLVIAGYVISRLINRVYLQRKLRRSISEIESLYPIEYGPISGTKPDDFLREIRSMIANEILRPLGAPLQLWSDPELHDVFNRLQFLVECYDELESLSDLLESFPESHYVRESVVGELQDSLTICAQDRIEMILYDYRDLLEEWKHIGSASISVDGVNIETEALDMIWRKLLNPELEYDERKEISEYSRQWLSTFKSVKDAEERIPRYDLSNIANELNETTTFDDGSLESKIARLKNIREVLDTATNVETIRHRLKEQSLILKYNKYSHEKIRSDIQECIDRIAISDIRDLHSDVTRLEGAEWNEQEISILERTDVEDVVRDLYKQNGYQTQINAEAKEKNIDVIATGDDRSLLIAIYHKQENGLVEKSAIQQVAGAISQFDAEKGVVISLSGYTEDALIFADEFGDQIQLLDKEKLSKALSNTKLVPVHLDGEGDTHSSNVVCPNCGKVVDRDIEYCRDCGTELPE